MSIKSRYEFEKLRAVGRIVRQALDAMAAATRPGITTGELDRIGGEVLARQGAESAPPKVYGFPAAVCISVNDEAIHGIPGSRIIRAGDLVKLDLVAEKDGYYADAAITVTAGESGELARRLVRCAESAFHRGAEAARAGNRVHEIGRAVERETRRCGFSVLRELCGHGVGRGIQSRPTSLIIMIRVFVRGLPKDWSSPSNPLWPRAKDARSCSRMAGLCARRTAAYRPISSTPW